MVFFYHSDEVQAGSLLFGGSDTTGVASHYYAPYSMAGIHIRTSPLLTAIIDWLGFVLICAILIATFVTAVSWTFYLFLRGQPIAATYVYKPLVSGRNPIRDEERQHELYKDIFEDDTDDKIRGRC